MIDGMNIQNYKINDFDFNANTEIIDDVTYRVRLVKIKSNHENLRTEVVEGLTKALPAEGKRFLVIADSIDSAASVRYVHTTEVEFVEQIGDEYMFHTANSSYRVKVLEVLSGNKI